MMTRSKIVIASIATSMLVFVVAAPVSAATAHNSQTDANTSNPNGPGKSMDRMGSMKMKMHMKKKHHMKAM